MKGFLKVGNLLLIAVIHTLIVSSVELSNTKESDSEKILNQVLDRQQQLLADLAKRSFKPEEIAKFEIDAAMWNRLRFDPDLQSIVAEVQEDIIKLKWGEIVVTPAWKKYGEKAYPLLDYYSQSSDDTRQKYGFDGIRSLGQPYSIIWLENRIKRNPLIQEFPYQLFIDEELDAIRSKTEFGLDDPATRNRLISLAKQHIKPNDDSSFDYWFLETMVDGNESRGLDASGLQKKIWKQESEKRQRELTKWKVIEQAFDEKTGGFDKIYAYFKNLSPEDQRGIIYDYAFDMLKVGEVKPFQRMLLHKLAGDSTSEYRGKAILELERHGDPIGQELLSEILDGDLSKLPYTERSFHYLRPLLKRYPQSRFSRGCREYEELTGLAYFQPFRSEIYERDSLQPSQQRIWEWKDWLSRYPDHPGADDAMFHLIQAYYDQNDVMSATRLWVKMLSEVVGDGDVAYRAFGYLRTLLDVGLSIEQIEELLPEIQSKPIIPIFKYALAVKYARIQNYDRALQISQGIDRQFNDVAEQVLRDPHQILGWDWSYSNFKEIIPEQRQRWQQLLKLQQQNTPESRYQVASNWATTDGYKNGYMAIWGLRRASHLPVGVTEGWYGDNTCKLFWVCDLKQRSAVDVRTAYQLGNPNAVAIMLYQKLLDDPTIPVNIREKTLYMMASTLLRQYENFPHGEHIRMHPLSGMKTSIVFWERGYRQPISENPELAIKLKSEVYSKEIEIFRDKATKESEIYSRKINNLIKSDYQRRIAELTNVLKKEFPNSVYIDDLLFSQYFLDDQKDPSFLKEIVEKYPNSDNAREAKFLLDRITKGTL